MISTSFISNDQLSLYLININNINFDYHKLVSYLDIEEHDTYLRYRVDADRLRFLLARVVLKSIIHELFELPIEQIHFKKNPYGKLYFNLLYQYSSIEFNISHSYEYCIIAMGLNSPIGVDIEYKKRNIDYLGLAQRFFSSLEYKQLLKLSVNLREDGFFKTWTCKEAFLKGIGFGITFGLDQFSVNVNPLELARILQVKSDRYQISDWALKSLLINDNYWLALCCSSMIHSFNVYQLTITEDNNRPKLRETLLSHHTIK